MLRQQQGSNVMRIAVRDFLCQFVVSALYLALLGGADSALAFTGLGPDGSDRTLYSMGGDGCPGAFAGGSARSKYLFPRGTTIRFITVQVGERSMKGSDFDGGTFYTGGDELFMIPKMESAIFFGLYMDFRQEQLGGTIGYSRAAHDISWAGLSLKPDQATSHFADLNFRFYARPSGAIQPFGLLGFSFNLIRMENGKYNAASDTFSDTSMWGAGMNWGAGVDYHAGRNIKLTAGARWHKLGYGRISGHVVGDGVTCKAASYFLSVGFNLDS
jgi:opacity protein-like surface antigen